MAIRLVQVTTTVTLLLVGLLVCGASDAVAQSQWTTLTDRAYININGAFQGTSDTAFTETLTDTLYGEAERKLIVAFGWDHLPPKSEQFGLTYALNDGQ